MATDLTIILPDRPGALMSAWNELRDAGINIEGGCGFPQAGATWVILHILVSDDETAAAAVEKAGFQVVARRDVDVHEVDDRPGALAEVFQRYADEGKNVDLMYVASNNRVIISTDDRHQERPGYTTLGEKRH